MKFDDISEVAGPKNCWPGYRKVGTKPGTGKNAGKRVNDCEKIKKESALHQAVKEFAPSFAGGDDGNDGFSEETLKRLAAQWWKGDEDPRVERTLMAAGWEIGQDEGYDEGGVFVVQSGDVNGKSYISWSAEDLEGMAEGISDEVNPADVGEYDREGDMAQSQLKTAEDAAAELRSILDADENLPEWVQSKITKAVDYLDTARDYMKSEKEGVAEGSLEEIDRRGFLKGLGAAAVAGATGGVATKADAQEINKWVKYAKELLVNSPLKRLHQNTGYDLRNWVIGNVSNWVSDYCFKTNSYNAKEVLDYSHRQGIEASGLDKQNALITAFLTNMKDRCQDYLDAYRASMNEKLKEYYNLPKSSQPSADQQKQQEPSNQQQKQSEELTTVYVDVGKKVGDVITRKSDGKKYQIVKIIGAHNEPGKRPVKTLAKIVESFEESVAEGWKEEAQELEDWSKEVNMRLYRAHESQRPALARQLSKLEQKHFGSEFTHPNLTNIVWSALRALQKGDMVHYDPQRVGQMPFGNIVGDDAKIIAQYNITRDELAGYRMLHDKGMVDNLEQFLKLRRLVRAKSWPLEYYEELEQLTPEEAWLKMANDLNWSKDGMNEEVQAKTDDKLLAYYAQRKADAEKKKKEQGMMKDNSALGQAVKEAGWGRRYTSYHDELSSRERDEQNAMDQSKRDFKRAELQHELGHEDDPNFERNLRQQQIDRDRGPWYIRIDGKIYRQKGQPKSFDWKRGANNYALAMVKNNPSLQGKIMLSKSAEDK